MWQVKYGLGGGFGGCGEWEDTDCKTEEEAVNYAYELACASVTVARPTHSKKILI